MAALLKKRALAEFTQVIQEEPRPVKKLRLTHVPPRPEEPPINLKECTTPAEIIDQLFKLEGLLPITAEAAEMVITQIKPYFHSDQDEGVRFKIVSLLGKLGRLPNVDKSYVCDDIVKWLKLEKSHKLISQMLSSMMEIGKSLPHDTILHQKIVQLSVKHLQDSSHIVRCKCLDIIGCLASPDQGLSPQSKKTQSMQAAIGNFTNDNDPRVRSSAFRVLLQWHERGLSIDKGAYAQASNSLKDDYEGVRVCAVQLIWVLSQLYTESLVKVSDVGNEEIRLIDDGFAKICNMVNDVSMSVRATAAGLLGSLHAVSPRFLEQTLDKKLMSNMRRKVSAHQRQKEHYESGEWATGQKWADDAPKEDVDPDNVSVMASGACGAFVHGLEDEFLEVRHAAIDSICELSSQSPMFSILSQDFLVDMLNDEIDMVRLNAINSLRKMGKHIVLREDQLDSILGVLKDFSYTIREALRGMIANVTLGTKMCLNSCVVALLDNLRRYEADRESIWDCMRHLGENHAFLVMSMTPDLMSCHPYFESIEPEVEDPAYVSILMLVFNATKKCPTMSALFPEHAARHYNYLRDTLPSLVPQLQLGSGKLKTASTSHNMSASQEARMFLSETLTRLESLDTMSRESALQLLDISIRDLGCVPELEPQLAATAKCHEMYLSCQRIFLKLVAYYNQGGSVMIRGLEDTVAASNIKQLYKLTNDMEHLFLGLGTTGRLQIKQLRLRAHTFQLLLQLQSSTGSTKGACVDYLQILNTLQRYLTKSAMEPDSFSKSILSEMQQLESCELQIFLTILEGSLSHHKCGTLGLESTVQHARGVITQPTGSSDTALQFIDGLTMAVDVVANLENVEKTQDVCVRVSYPDQMDQYTSPKPVDIRQLGPLKHKLVTKVLISHTKWSESSPVEICLVQRYKPGHMIRGKQEASSTASTSSSKVYDYIELSKPVKLSVLPISEKR